MEETVWSLAPAGAAIVLALVTKEVYFSLLVGIVTGVLFFSGFHIGGAFETMFSIMGEKLGSNSNILDIPRPFGYARVAHGKIRRLPCIWAVGVALHPFRTRGAVRNSRTGRIDFCRRLF